MFTFFRTNFILLNIVVITGNITGFGQEIQNAADNNAFNEGKVIFTLGYGIPNWAQAWHDLNYGTSYSNDYSSTGSGPVHFKMEYGLTKKIAIGASINYCSYTAIEKYSGSGSSYEERLKFTSYSGLLRVNVHFAGNEKIDGYVGCGLGYRTAVSVTSYSNNMKSDETYSALLPIGAEATIGMRYYFTPEIGIYCEAGFAKSIVQAGLALSF